MIAWRTEPSGWRALTSNCRGALEPSANRPVMVCEVATWPGANTWPKVTGTCTCSVLPVLSSLTSVRAGTVVAITTGSAGTDGTVGTGVTGVNTRLPDESIVTTLAVALRLPPPPVLGSTTIVLAGGKVGSLIISGIICSGEGNAAADWTGNSPPPPQADRIRELVRTDRNTVGRVCRDLRMIDDRSKRWGSNAANQDYPNSTISR